MKNMKKTLVAMAAVVYLSGCAKKNELSQSAQDIDGAMKSQMSTTNAALAVQGSRLLAGINWADTRDNFVDGWIIPSGITSSDNYATVAAKSSSTFNGVIATLPGVNAIRLGINPPSVTQSWWNSYTAVIDQALAKNLKVILCCWESSASKDGKIDDINAFWKMWDVVLAKYGSKANVYFEVFNEPHGYNLADISAIYVQFLSRYSSTPRNRILLSGTGYSQDVTKIGADSRFNGCLLAMHNYTFFNNSLTTVSQWEANWRAKFGAFASRTIVTEYGSYMTTGNNYQGAASNAQIAFIVGSTNVFRADGLSSVYWPGIRDNDPYRLLNRGGSGTNFSISVTNASGVARVRYGWGL